MTTPVEPLRLIEALLAAGWTEAGRRTGVYIRLHWPEPSPRNRSLVIPLDRAAGDYDDLLGDALAELDYAHQLGVTAGAVLESLNDPDRVEP